MRKSMNNAKKISDNERDVGSGGNSPGAGPGGYCECPNCGIQIEHQRGTPCFYMKCPKCGAEMIRT
jgi:hypothetical protein